MNWTDAMDGTLRTNRGIFSSAQIGALLGVSRNAVIGRAQRLGLDRLKGIGRPRKPRPPKPYVKQRAPIPDMPRIDDAAIPFAQRRSLQELTNKTCRWPVGDPCLPEFFFCGAVPAEDRPYCLSHCAVAFESPKQRTERHAVARRAA